MGPHVKQINIRLFQVLGTIQKTLLGGGAFLGGAQILPFMYFY